MGIFESVDFLNHTPFENDFIASVSNVWEKAKILGVTYIVCDCEHKKQIEEDAAHRVSLRFFANQKGRRILVAKETLSFSHNGSKSINYSIKKGFENETI